MSPLCNIFPRLYPTLITSRPELSIFALQCINFKGSSLTPPDSPTLSDTTVAWSNPSIVRDNTAVSKYDPDEYERTSYYNGIAGKSDHPALIYRSDMFTTLFPKPVGQHIPVKSVHGVFGTPLNRVWVAVCLEICGLINARNLPSSSISLARFITRTRVLGEEDMKKSIGPVVIWIGVNPGSISSDTAHDISQEILALLLKNEVEDVVVEWRESVTRML